MNERELVDLVERIAEIEAKDGPIYMVHIASDPVTAAEAATANLELERRGLRSALMPNVSSFDMTVTEEPL